MEGDEQQRVPEVSADLRMNGARWIAMAVHRWIGDAPHLRSQKTLAATLLDRGVFKSLSTAQAQISRYVSGQDVPRREVAMAITELIEADVDETCAYWNEVEGRVTLEAQGWAYIGQTASAEETTEHRVIISRHASFSIKHPSYSAMVQRLWLRGASYEYRSRAKLTSRCCSA
jgi:hypothetical protein